MRKLVASAVYVSLSAGIFAQQPSHDDAARPESFATRQARLVSSYHRSGDYHAAEASLRDWLAAEPAASPMHLTVQNNLAHLLREEGRNTEARQLFAQTIDSPGVTPDQRLSALIGLADIDEQRGTSKASIDEWNSAVELAHNSGDTTSEADALRGLGHTWLCAGSPARAEPLLRRSLRMVENDTTASPLQVAASLGAMAEYYHTENKLALAEDAWSRALAIERKVLGDAHPQVALLMEMLAGVYSERGEKELARDYAERAVDSMRQWFGDASPAAGASLANLAMVEQRAHTLDNAAHHYQTAIGILRGFPELAPTLKVVLQRYAGVLKAMHRDREAKALDSEVKAFRLN